MRVHFRQRPSQSASAVSACNKTMRGSAARWGWWPALAMVAALAGEACSSGPVPRRPANGAPVATRAVRGDGDGGTSQDSSRISFRGTCDASGAVALGGARFAVADDEDNVLRVYDSSQGGDPLYMIDVSPSLALPRRSKSQEADIEAATRLADRALWLTSHGRDSKGQLQAGRFRFFATTAPAEGDHLRLVGTPYRTLLDDLLEAPQLAQLGLREAAERAPKAGGLNIEGMTRRADERSVLIGFRSPRPQHKALLLPLLNPLEMVAGQRAQIGEPQLVDLGGLGVRSLSLWRDRYLIMAGAMDDEAASRLFLWDGASRVQLVADRELAGFNPEAFVSHDDSDRVLLLSDDGSREIDGQRCKKLKDAAHKQFRGLWVHLPSWASASHEKPAVAAPSDANPADSPPQSQSPIAAASFKQLVVVVAPDWSSWHARLQRYERGSGSASEFRPVGAALPAVLGYAGYGWGDGLHGVGAPLGRSGPVKREGDGRSPAGVFTLGVVYGYADAASLQLPYRRATADVRCVDDSSSTYYNQIISAKDATEPYRSAERMLRDDVLYELALDIEHNRRPVRPGHGSCIFAHLWSGPTTPVHGCTALAKPDLQTLLTWLRPGEAAWVALPESELAALRMSWGLPNPP